MGFLSGLISPGLTATAQAVSGAQQGGIEGYLQKRKLDAADADQKLKALLAGQSMRNIDSEIFAREHPRPTYDSDRGVMIDGTSATATPVAGVKPKDPVANAVAVAEATKGIPTYSDLHPKPDQTLVQTQEPGGAVVYTHRDEAAGMNAPSPNARGTAAIMKDVAANQTQVSVIDDALKELDAHPDAVGLKRGAADLPIVGGAADALNQRLDPNGVAARASLANVSSLVIKDRSGSAVTISESARLRPFIPSTGDTPETIRIKLGKLRQAIETETKLLQQTSGMKAGGMNASPTPEPSKAPSHTGASDPGGTIHLGKPSRAQALWDAAVAKHGEAKVIQEYGPRPEQ